MPIDTAAKRSSALSHLGATQYNVPFPDGTIGQGDRQAVVRTYSGILVGEAVVVVGGAHGIMLVNPDRGMNP